MKRTLLRLWGIKENLGLKTLHQRSIVNAERVIMMSIELAQINLTNLMNVLFLFLLPLILLFLMGFLCRDLYICLR